MLTLCSVRQLVTELHVGMIIGMIYDTRYASLDWIDFGLETPHSGYNYYSDNYDSKQY